MATKTKAALRSPRARVNLRDLLRENIHFVQLRDGVHMYWRSQRLTLCKKDKRDAPRLYEATPTCDACYAEYGRVVFGEIREPRGP